MTIQQHDLIRRTVDYIQERLQSDATGHDWWHVYRVWQLAKRLAASEGGDLVIIELGALLHDIADWKFHAGDDSAGPRAAREWLTQQQADHRLIDAVCHIVQHVSFKGAGVASEMESLEGKIVQDADRLDALGAVGIGRAFAYGGSRGRSMHDPLIKPTQHASFAAYQASQSTTLNHFYEKLLLLQDRLNTTTARQLAAERHRFMEAFVQRFLAEWEGQR